MAKIPWNIRTKLSLIPKIGTVERIIKILKKEDPYIQRHNEWQQLRNTKVILKKNSLAKDLQEDAKISG